MRDSRITLHPAEWVDAEDILALQKLAFQTEAILHQDWSIPPLTQTIDQIQDEFSSALFLKAVLNGAIVGSVRAYLLDGTCHVGRLIVHPENRRQGIGSQLMQAIEASFPSATRFELFTSDRSEDNIKLYEKIGYSIFRHKRLSTNISLVFMQKMR